LLVQYTLWGDAMLFLFSPTGVPVAGGGARSNLPVGKYRTDLTFVSLFNIFTE
jgi:hypothetical protein